jgi:hypothetical protein
LKTGDSIKLCFFEKVGMFYALYLGNKIKATMIDNKKIKNVFWEEDKWKM